MEVDRGVPGQPCWLTARMNIGRGHVDVTVESTKPDSPIGVVCSEGGFVARDAPEKQGERQAEVHVGVRRTRPGYEA